MVLSLLGLCSCMHQTPLEKIFSEANKVKVYINYGSTVPEIHFETNDIDKIKDWLKYIDEKTDATGSCNYEGKLIAWYTESDSTVMKFSLANGCTQIAYTAEGKSMTKALTADGIKFLEDLKKIR